MENQEEKKVFSVWVSWKNRVISFRKAEDFEQRDYPSREEMFRFAIQRVSEGYKVQ